MGRTLGCKRQSGVEPDGRGNPTHATDGERGSCSVRWPIGPYRLLLPLRSAALSPQASKPGVTALFRSRVRTVSLHPLRLKSLGSLREMRPRTVDLRIPQG